MLLDEHLTRVAIGGYYAVYNKLAHGFLENVYIGALEHELRKRGLHVAREVPIAVWYDGVIVGTYRVDLLVEHRLVLEIKACKPNDEHSKQVFNYLRCTDLELGLLFYFDTRPLFRRLIFRNPLKEHSSRRIRDSDADLASAVSRGNGNDSAETTADRD